MEDKNLQPLVPDMLYRHGQPEVPEPEDLPQEAALFSDMPAPEEIPADVLSPAVPEEECPAPEGANVAPVPVAEEAPSVAFLPEESIPIEGEVPTPGYMEPEPVEDPLAAFIPVDEIAFSDAPAASPLEDTIPPVMPTAAPEPYQPICDDDTLAWLTGEEALPQELSKEDIYETMVPESQEQAPVDYFTEPIEPEFNDMFIDKTGEEEPPPVKKKKNNPPVKKGRPKRKKGYGFFGIPHLLATLVWLAIIVAIGTSLGKLLWVGAADVLAFGRESKMVTVTIVDSDNIDIIAAKLKDAGLVKYPELFKFYAKLTGSEEEITTGTFELNTNLDYHALSNALSPSSSNRTVVKVTIPEGYSCRQIFNLLAASNICSVESLEEYAANGDLPEYWFLEDVARGDRYCLEGYLFPDTYEFYANSTPKEALNKMLSGFNTRYTEEMRTQVEILNEHLSGLMRANGKSEDYIAANQLTVRDVLIVASLIEEETAGTAESATIASVIYNRLFNWGENPAYLNIDATIYYALDGNIDPTTGNTMVLTSADLQIDSPFNTYKYAGLTPGPITNPGLASLHAALEPSDRSYYYYVLNPDTGLHQFSKTLEEHEKWIAEFYSSED